VARFLIAVWLVMAPAWMLAGDGVPVFTNADLERYGNAYATPSSPPASALSDLDSGWEFVERTLAREADREDAQAARSEQRRREAEAREDAWNREPRYSVPYGGVYGWGAIWERYGCDRRPHDRPHSNPPQPPLEPRVGPSPRTHRHLRPGASAILR